MTKIHNNVVQIWILLYLCKHLNISWWASDQPPMQLKTTKMNNFQTGYVQSKQTRQIPLSFVK